MTDTEWRPWNIDDDSPDDHSRLEVHLADGRYFIGNWTILDTNGEVLIFGFDPDESINQDEAVGDWYLDPVGWWSGNVVEWRYIDDE